MQVLLIEDDERIAGPLAEGLGQYGFTVERVRTGAAALAAAEPEMVLLDLGLPDMDGIDVCRMLRQRSEVPIIMITARGEEPHAVAAPVGAADGVRHVGPLGIDRRTRQVHLAGQPVALAPKEFDLLAHLARDPGAVCSRQQIMDQVWDPHFFGPTRTLDVHVAALRRKLGDPAWIETIRRVGFRLRVPDASAPAPGVAPGPGQADR
ncbi:DNA-binding response regulator RegX3 [Streptomyces himastatinicus ATCC 53653]|uniref:DNA-binding response regulator RegX3 n=1 Tax=Streptomyces himastatinicus ATCC 53653 TaxID=457427 RepID=D9WW01_9ACTN|nr:response regulator transcription factor [Streptomyces himastatinicus]EFL24510.1 DNA-binding response regulator RegX3 [Streptomyces himastatinicus ATCC 53653]